MRSKLKFILPLLVLVVLGAVYQLFLAKPSAEAKPRVRGHVYVLPREFLVNLSDDRFAKLNVALVLHGEEQVKPASEAGHTPPEGFGALPQEAIVRDLVTDTLTDASADQLIERAGRQELKRRLAREIRAHTDVKVDDVLLTDVAVQ